MRNVVCVLSMMALWIFPQDALAKAETVKITVSGGSLAGSINVTDSRILDLSHAWGDSFLDRSRPPTEQAPQGAWPYEVSFYSQFAENDVRKTCVLYYYPSTSTDAGLVYLPGSRSAVWALNVGTVLRPGRDGKWNYASPTWDAMMKSTIARAESDEIELRMGKASPKTTLESWTMPRKGWLYVLDPQPESAGSRIWLFDPGTAAVMGSIRTGYQPDISVSPDGSRLYIASGERETGEVAVVNTADGSVREISFPERVLYTPWYKTLPPFTSIAVSSDGKTLRILQQSSFPPEKAELQIWTFDAAKGSFSQTRVEIDDCRSGVFVSPSTASEFKVICPSSKTLHAIRSGADSRLMSHEATKLMCGDVHCIDGAAVDGLDWPRSPDGTKIYVGYGPPTPDNMATSKVFRVFDTDRWKQLGTVQTSIPFWSAAMSLDGRFIYALAPKQHAIIEIEATTLRENRTLSLGKTPALAVVAP